MIKLFFFCLLLLACLSPPASAQSGADSTSAIKEYDQHFNEKDAAMGYINMLTPQQKERSDSYFEGGYWILVWELILQIFIAWIFLYTGLSKWIMSIASRVQRINIQNLIYILLYLFLAILIAFPFEIYTGFLREHKYGLSNMSFGQWLSEEMISTFIFILFGSLVIMVVYIIIRKVARQWWIWGCGVVVVFLVFTIFISPVFLSPLFNDYKPLEEEKIKDDILSMVRANGVPVNNVYQFDASKQSDRVSANVSGIGSTIRVSLNDNLLTKCSPAEIRSVMAHELGHYVLNHMYKLLIYFSIVLIIGFAAVNFVMNKAISRFGNRWGIGSISDVRTLPVFVMFFSLFVFIATPVTNSIIRTTESEADIFGLNVAREPDGFAAVSMKLSEYRKINPGWLEEIIFFDHPSGRARIFMSMKWKAEHIRETDPSSD